MNVTIVGVGLMGGSIAIDLKELGFASRIFGVDRSQENLDKAIRRKIIDEALPLKEAIEQSNLVILATPVNVLIKLIPEVLDLVVDQIVLELGSSKVEVLKPVTSHPNRGNLVALHPMAGTEFSGPEAAIPRLFKDKVCVVVDEVKSLPKALKLTSQMLDCLQMKSVFYNAEEHDLHVAYVSHISHISSFSLALTVLSKEENEKRIFDLASGGFSSTVRLAKSNAAMWVPIFEQNRDNILDVLDEHINSLERFRSLLIAKNFQGIEKLIHQSNEIKRILG